MNVPHYEQELDYSCLPACVRMILAFYGQKQPESSLRILLKTRIGGTSPAQLMWKLPELGFNASVQMGSQLVLQQQLAVGQPCIVHVWTEPLAYWEGEAIHALVVCGLEANNILVNDPILQSGPTIIELDEFFQAWAATDYLTITISPIESGNP